MQGTVSVVPSFSFFQSPCDVEEQREGFLLDAELFPYR